MDKEQREVCLRKMRETSDAFYRAAFKIGNHAFVEFCGLMNEYIKICQENHERGIDFTNCNTHCSERMVVRPYEMAYLREKLECIFEGIEVDKKTKLGDIAVGAASAAPEEKACESASSNSQP